MHNSCIRLKFKLNKNVAFYNTDNYYSNNNMKTIFVTSQVCLISAVINGSIPCNSCAWSKSPTVELFPTKARVRKIYQQDLLSPELLLFLVYI